MLDIRPVGYVIGLMVVALGVTMLAPLAADIRAGNGHWPVFFESAVISILVGGLVLAQPGCFRSARRCATLPEVRTHDSNQARTATIFPMAV